MPSLGSILETLDWLQLQVPADAAIVSRLLVQIDEGEAEALALALERQALLLVDDLPARNVARSLGLQATGTLGVLIRAKQNGPLSAVAPLLENLRAVGFWMDEALRTTVLVQAAEL